MINRLRDRGWLPTAKSGEQMVRNRLLDMVEKGELERDDDTGTYFLPREAREGP